MRLIEARVPIGSSLVATATAALALGFFSAVATHDIWGPSKKSKYCEGGRAQEVLRQPANTWTNLAYVSAGGWVIGRALQVQRMHVFNGDRREKPASSAEHNEPHRLPWPLSVNLGASSCLLGFGSCLYHASLTRTWQQVDVAAMYWVMNASLAATVWRLCQHCPHWKISRSSFVVAVLLLMAIVADIFMYIFKWRMSASVVFNTQLSFVVVSEFAQIALDSACAIWKGMLITFLKKRARHLCLAIGALVVGLLGLTFRQLGVHFKKRGGVDFFCTTFGAFQPHAAWHILTAISLLLLFELVQEKFCLEAHAIRSGTPIDTTARKLAKDNEYADGPEKKVNTIGQLSLQEFSGDKISHI